MMYGYEINMEVWVVWGQVGVWIRHIPLGGAVLTHHSTQARKCVTNLIQYSKTEFTFVHRQAFVMSMLTMLLQV